MTKVQIAVATDMRMFEPTLTAMMSAVEHSSRPVTVHFFGYEISDDARQLLNNAIQCWPKTELRFYDLSEVFDESNFDGKHSAVTNLPLHIPKLMEKGRVLFLDSDTLTQADIVPLFEIDMKGCHIAAARDYGFLLSWSEFRPNGVRAAIAKALLNLVPWRKETGAERIVPAWGLRRFRSLLRYYSTGKNTPFSNYRRLIYPYPIYDYPNTGVVLFDVDSIKGDSGLVSSLSSPIEINDDTMRIVKLLKGRIFTLDPCWNALCGIYHRYSQVHEAIVLDGSRYAHEEAKIVHHVGAEKPWHDYSLDELRLDPQKVREQIYSDLNLAAHGHPVSAVFHELKDQECVEEYCDLTKSWREAHDRYMNMLKE